MFYKNNYLGELPRMIYWFTDTKRRQTGLTRMSDKRQECRERESYSLKTDHSLAESVGGQETLYMKSLTFWK